MALELPLVGGFAVGLAALHAHFKDVRDLLTSVLTLLFFLTRSSTRWRRCPTRRSPWWSSSRRRRRSPSPTRRRCSPAASRRRMLWLQMAVWALAGFAFGAVIFRRLRETLVEAV